MKGVLLAALLFLAVFCYNRFSSRREIEVLKQIVDRLEADSRIAQVLVTGVKDDPASGKTFTTIKFLEYGADGKPVAPRYFTFSGNIIQFQSLVVRFEDFYVRKGDPFRGKSVYLFLKVFFLDGPNTEVFDITPLHQIPLGYKIEKNDTTSVGVEEAFWQRFWTYALDKEEAKKLGVKNAQIEAPGTKFIPGTLYTIVIEHDGGMRIDTQKLPEILKGERIL